MNVIQRPRSREFCSTMRDYIIDTDKTITFAVEYGGKKVLEEDYVPDANYQVRIRKLGGFCELALWGVWCAGEMSWQADAAGIFTFLINGVKDAESFVMFSRLQTRKDAGQPGWLSEVNQKVTCIGVAEYLSSLIDKGDVVKITGYSEDGATKEKTFYTSGEESSSLITFDVSADRVKSLFQEIDIIRYKLACNGNEFIFHVDSTHYAERWCFRYKNVYDMPEVLTATGGLKLDSANEGDTSFMYGVERKFSIKVTDEYTANSGVILLQSDYKLWHNLLNAQEVDFRVNEEWLPVVITKHKFERDFRRSVLKAIEFSFRFADPEQNNLIEV